MHTFGHPPAGEWVLVDGRHVERVGVGDPPGADRVVDLPGATILPGFIDAHVHLTSLGPRRENEDVAARPVGRGVARGRGGSGGRRGGDDEGVVSLQGYDETPLGEPHPADVDALDTVTATPLVIRRTDGHVALLNTAALNVADALEPPGVERDDAGRPTGLVTGTANRLVGRWVADRPVRPRDRGAAAVRSRRGPPSYGVTTVHEMALPLGVRAAGRRRPPRAPPAICRSSVEVVLGVDGRAQGGRARPPARSAATSRPTGRSAPRTAAVGEPHTSTAPAPAELAFDDDDPRGFFRDGHDAGLQVGMHAIGDRAIEQVLGAWERIYRRLDSRERRHFRARRHRIEHFEMPTAEQIERAAMLGLAVSMQPTFDATWGGTRRAVRATASGPDRAWAMNPLRTLLERGLELGVGSDAPVVPWTPGATVQAIEHHHDPTQRLPRADAIRIHTTGSARLAHHEEKKGVLEPGMHADFAAYDVDPLAVDDVAGLRPILTVSLGREVWLA